MLKRIYAKDGPWEKFAGKDGRMQLEEGRKMDAAIRAESSKAGFDLPEMKKGLFKRYYTAYDKLSKGDGFTKEDAMKGDKIQNAIRKWLVNWKPSKEQRKAFRPVFKTEIERWEAMDEDSKGYKFFKRWLNHRAEREIKKMNKEMLKKGGAFDQFAGEDGQMSLDEAKKMNAVIRKEAGKMLGEEIPGYTDEQFKQMYDAYNMLSEGEGFNKEDTMWA